jgi:hypothetical protein
MTGGGSSRSRFSLAALRFQVSQSRLVITNLNRPGEIFDELGQRQPFARRQLTGGDRSDDRG